jgi:hypothetical protein
MDHMLQIPSTKHPGISHSEFMEADLWFIKLLQTARLIIKCQDDELDRICKVVTVAYFKELS